MPFWKAGKNDDQVLDELKETQKQNADEFVKKRWSLEHGSCDVLHNFLEINFLLIHIVVPGDYMVCILEV